MVFVRAIISEQGQQHGIPMSAKLQIRSEYVTKQNTPAPCATPCTCRLYNVCTATAEFILLAKEAETVDGAHASTHLTLFYDVFNMSLSFRRRARGKLRSRAFIFSSSSQHTVRSEFPSWWSCKYKNTKWTYLWNGIIHTFLQQWIKES